MAEYNPTLSYNWSASEEFTISGRDLEVVYNNLKTVLSRMMSDETTTLKPSSMLMLIDAYRQLEMKFAEYVESGKVKAQETEVVAEN